MKGKLSILVVLFVVLFVSSVVIAEEDPIDVTITSISNIRGNGAIELWGPDFNGFILGKEQS